MCVSEKHAASLCEGLVRVGVGMFGRSVGESVGREKKEERVG